MKKIPLISLRGDVADAILDRIIPAARAQGNKIDFPEQKDGYRVLVFSNHMVSENLLKDAHLRHFLRTTTELKPSHVFTLLKNHKHPDRKAIAAIVVLAPPDAKQLEANRNYEMIPAQDMDEAVTLLSQKRGDIGSAISRGRG